MAKQYVRISCPSCHLEFAQEKKFIEHHTLDHEMFPDEELFVVKRLEGIQPTCGCGCGKRPKWGGWKKGYVSSFVRGHNASVDSCWLNEQTQREMAKKRAEGYAAGKYKVWNDGMTKETSQKVAELSAKIGETMQDQYASGVRTAWQTGLTKETSVSIAQGAKKHSDGFKDGTIRNWSDGLTKESDERLARAAAAIGIAASVTNKVQPDELKSRIEQSGKFLLVSSTEDYKHRRVDRLRVKCTNCGEEQDKSLAMIEESPVCFKCHPKESRAQLEVFEFVKSLAPDTVSSDRSVLTGGRELDIYVPSKHLAIEFNGLYWHSVACQPDKLYHDKKTIECAAVGIKLFHIFEDEWREKPQIIKSMIVNALGMNSRKLFARKCEVKVLDPDTRKAFFNASHIDGDCRSEIAWGLFYAGELVSALSLRRPFHMSVYADAREVGRFASALGTTVVGGLGKLVSVMKVHCREKGIERVISYADTRLGPGDSYVKVGFTDKGFTASRFWWTDFVKRFNRFGVRADKKNGKTQKQAAIDAGVVAIWGCRNRLFEMLPMKDVTHAS